MYRTTTPSSPQHPGGPVWKKFSDWNKTQMPSNAWGQVDLHPNTNQGWGTKLSADNGNGGWGDTGAGGGW
ncbi:unnamed protein product [Absidia cylindrospora]